MTKSRSALLLLVVLALPSAVAAQAAMLVFSAQLDNNWDLFLFEHGQLTRLSKTAIDERGPALSTNRAKVAYTTSDGSLWVTDLRSRVNMKLGGAPGQYGYPAWVPNKEELVYTLYSFSPPSEDADFYRCVLNPRQYQLFIRQTGPQDYIAFSPQGDKVAYMSSVATLLAQSMPFVSQQLWVMSLQDGKSEPLFWGSSKNSRPAWSPDGRMLAFSSDRSGHPQIWLADFQNSGALSQLTQGPGDKTHPCWAGDGRLYFISNVSGIDEVYSMGAGTKGVRKEDVFGSRKVPTQDLSCR